MKGDTSSTAGAASEGTAAGGAPEQAGKTVTFEVLPLSAEVRRALAEIGYLHPTPVQLAVWEPVTRAKDAVVQARTGTGKTAAFGLPIVDQIVRKSLTQPQALVLCPTRELALQVAAELERLGKYKGVRVAAIYGGAPMPRQIELLASGVHVIVGTPGRVLDHLRRRTLNPVGIRLLVLDECDEMLSMGFERELTAIVEQLPAERQTLLFSATIPADIERMAKNRLRSPEFITLSGDHIGALEIQHFVYMVASDKLGALVRVLETENPESAIIFCNTRDETENVAQALKRNGYGADWLNGDLPQSDREKVMSAAREGRLRFLVATDVAARGIDISFLTHVINYDFPMETEAYVHRTGRTGRMGRTGTAISLITPRDIGTLYFLRLTFKIRPLEKQLPTAGELKTRAEADLVTMLAEAFAPKGTHPDDLALARRVLSHDRSEEIIAGLLRDHLTAYPRLPEDASTARRARTVAAPVREPTRGRARPPEAKPAAPSPPAEPSGVETPPVDTVRANHIVEPARPRHDERRSDERRRPPRDEGRGEGDASGGRREPRRSEGERHTEPRATRDRPAPANEPRARPPRRHADFSTWQPPEEEGDDEPILREPRGGRSRGPSEARRGEGGGGARQAHEAPAGEGREARDADFVELYVSIGRRDGVRAADVQRAFEERAGLDKGELARIRVRERHTFVSVRRGTQDKAIASLNGTTIAGRPLTVEVARERVPSEADRSGSEMSSADTASSERGVAHPVANHAESGPAARSAASRTSETTE